MYLEFGYIHTCIRTLRINTYNVAYRNQGLICVPVIIGGLRNGSSIFSEPILEVGHAKGFGARARYSILCLGRCN